MPVPVKNYDYTVSETASMAYVRNHWYQIEVGKVFRLGQAYRSQRQQH